MNNKIRQLIIRFNNEIAFSEVPLLRGAVLNAMGDDVALLFHNHMEDGFRYAYPLIQYKRINKKAAIVCVGDGVDTIAQLFSDSSFDIKLGDRPLLLEIERINPIRPMIQVWDTTFKYRLRNWLALNSDNYIRYSEIEEYSERILFLEKVLIGNLLSFAKGLGITLDKEILCKILSINEPRLCIVKGIKMMSFDVDFKTNVSIPNFVGLGKHVSIGYGTVVRIVENNNKNE